MNSISLATAGRGFLLIPLTFALASLALSPAARADCREGCAYPGNTFLGDSALFYNTNGIANTAIGAFTLVNNINGSYNTATGDAALFSNTIGSANTANGYIALFYNTASANTATGHSALFSNTTGGFNTANGKSALYSNTTGGYNTANGNAALYSNTIGSGNTANGNGALYNNDADYNTANGASALYSNTTGLYNTANGAVALYGNTIGNNNTANGNAALHNNTTGNLNTASGVNALYYNTAGNNNTANGISALLNNTGSNNIGLGFYAGKNLTTGSGNICIGAAVFGVAGENNTTRIRNVYGSVASGRAVYVNSDHKIGTLVSTRRVKENIKAMDKLSDTIFALRPVSFRYKQEIDASGSPQFGLIAEEVANVNADLVTRDSEGKPETVRYEAVNAMLLNEFLKEHATVQEFKTTIAHQQKQIEALTAGLQKVSDQLEMSKPAPQTVKND